ncbi:hypothetical protein D3C76_705640 [compost metagenome]
MLRMMAPATRGWSEIPRLHSFISPALPSIRCETTVEKFAAASGGHCNARSRPCAWPGEDRPSDTPRRHNSYVPDGDSNPESDGYRATDPARSRCRFRGRAVGGSSTTCNRVGELFAFQGSVIGIWQRAGESPPEAAFRRISHSRTKNAGCSGGAELFNFGPSVTNESYTTSKKVFPRLQRFALSLPCPNQEPEPVARTHSAKTF